MYRNFLIVAGNGKVREALGSSIRQKGFTVTLAASGSEALMVVRNVSVEVVLIENQHDPDPADTTYESTFIYLIRLRGRLRVETDRHRLGLFPLPVWRRLLRTTGFRVTQVVGEPDRPGARGNATFVCVRPAIKRQGQG